MSFGGRNVPEEICETLSDLNYRARYTILNAAYFGVPQARERLFIVALAHVTGATPDFPEPRIFLDLPKGYEGSRRVALKHVEDASRFIRPIPLRIAPFRVHKGSARRSACHLRACEKPLQSSAGETLRHAALSRVRRQPVRLRQAHEVVGGFHTADGTNGHLVRLTPRDFAIFARMKPGADYLVARQIAEQMFEDALAARPVRVRKHSRTNASVEIRVLPRPCGVRAWLGSPSARLKLLK